MDELASYHRPGVRADAAGKPVIIGEFGVDTGPTAASASWATHPPGPIAGAAGLAHLAASKTPLWTTIG